MPKIIFQPLMIANPPKRLRKKGLQKKRLLAKRQRQKWKQAMQIIKFKVPSSKFKVKKFKAQSSMFKVKLLARQS